MSDCHSNSECEHFLTADEIENNQIDSSEYISQLDKIVTLKGKLVVYLSILYGAISVAGLTYLFIF